MRIQSWNYLDTVEVIGSIPVAPIRSTLLHSSTYHHYFPYTLGFRRSKTSANWAVLGRIGHWVISQPIGVRVFVRIER
jgi:hypothetical protein